MAFTTLAAQILSFTALFFGLLTLVKSRPGIPGAVLWLPKLLATAWSPFLAIAGASGAIFGLFSAHYFTALSGFLGAALAIRHVLSITSVQADFAGAFGPGWETGISDVLKQRLWKKRFTLVQPAGPDASMTSNIALGPSGKTREPLLCDIWEPASGVPRSGLAVIYLHGGLWQALDKDFLSRPLFRRLASQGHVILDLAYALAPGADLDRMLGDVKQAILWLKDGAQDYQVNPQRIVLMGVSGGAHLALLAAYAPEHPAFGDIHPGADFSVKGVVTTSVITDLAAYFQEYGISNPKQPDSSAAITDDLRPRVYDRTWMDKFMTNARIFPAYRYGNIPGGSLLLLNLVGGTPQEIPEIYRQASPITHVGPHCPPTLLLAGQDDIIIPPSHSRSLHHVLQEINAPSIYIEFPGSVHAYDNYFGVSQRVAPAAQISTYYVERFLALLA